MSSPSKKDSPSHPPQSSNLTQLSADSPNFAYIEYFLRLSLHASTAKIVSAWEVSNPQLTLQFDKRSKAILTVDSWVDIANLEQTEDEVLRRGLIVSSGARFHVGRINAEQQIGKGRISKRFLLCKVAVGRAYNATEEYARTSNLPDGYDSFIIDNNNDGLQYIIKDSSQVLPVYVATFEYDPEVEQKSRQRVICENCERQPAAVFCKADSANLCQCCDEQLHQSKLAQKHPRVPLDAGPQTFSACRSHPEKLVEFFCPTCSRPVCVNCKMIGHHSTGEAARHRLVTVAEAFKTVSEAAHVHDPILEQRRVAIQSRMAAVNERAQQVKDNATHIHTQLEELYKKAESELQSITAMKLNILKGDTREFSRELAEIDQLEAFVKYQQEGTDATQFILDWSHHQRLRNELHAFPFARDTCDVHADIRIVGGIQVHVEGAIPMQSIEEQGPKNLLLDKQRYSRAAASRVAPSIFDLPTTPTKTRKPTDFLE